MFVLSGGRILSGDGVMCDGSLLVRNGCLDSILPDGATAPAGARVLDVGGALILPGIIDLHGDAFERQLMPRPDVHMPMAVALLETDRQMLANGITTAYHGLTWSWEPGLRGGDAARAFIAELARLRPYLGCDTRLHLRHEIANLAAEPELGALLAAGQIDLLAFNDHIDDIRRALEKPAKAGAYAARTGLTVPGLYALIDSLLERRAEWPESRARLAAMAAAHGVAMASHDDPSPAFRQQMQAIGCAISEFPVDAATARSARDMGSPVVLGAPNILRGGSHCGRLNAAEAIGAGLGTVLTSDYYYPALLLAAFRLAQDGVCYLPDAWGLVSWNAADAVGLTDRGRIAPGLRADLTVVDDSLPDCPRVQATFVNGHCLFNALGLRAQGVLLPVPL